MLWRKLQLNWRYGLGEFCIVVLGVLVALWFENWNSDREDRVLEREYVASLITDLELDNASIQDAMQFAEVIATESRTVLDSIGQREISQSPEEFLWAVNHTSYFRLPSYSRTTIDDLMSTGNMNVLQSKALRGRISEYYSTIEFNTQWNELARDAQARLSQINASILDVRFREYMDAKGSIGSPWAPASISVSAEDAEATLNVLAQHAEAKGLISYMIREQGALYGRLTQIRSKLELLKDDLIEYLDTI